MRNFSQGARTGVVWREFVAIQRADIDLVRLPDSMFI